MNSFAILRTNVGLTTNIKIMIDSNYQLSIDSIESNYFLSADRYKKFIINKDTYYDDVIPSFFKNTPPDVAFDVKFNNDLDNMSNNFESQYDELYNYGAKNIYNNKNYAEEYEYFAPIYINPNKMPSKFIIFRVDGTGIGLTDKVNFKSDIVNKFKTIKVFDLERTTNIGYWLNKNFKDNIYFPKSPLEIDFKKLEFSKWNGIEYEFGGYASKSIIMDSVFEKERELYVLDKFIYDSWRNNKVVFPNILNMTFLFNDTPSVLDTKRRWSINRYYGFYVDSMDYIQSITPYKTAMLRSDVRILTGNLLYSESDIKNPFVENWDDTKTYFIEYNGAYYKIIRFFERDGEEILQFQDDGFINEDYVNINEVFYKIVSDINLVGKQDYINKNYGIINSDNVIVDDDNIPITISDFDSADVWVIEVANTYHNLIKIDDKIVVNTDYSFRFYDTYYEYSKAGVVSKFLIFDNQEIPTVFKIYRLNFTDIKDFDTRIVDTEYSKYEYEYKNKLTDTLEPKMYFTNPLSDINPKQPDEFLFDNSVVNIPVSSEYTANYETFKLIDGRLTDLWRVNPIYCRWGYMRSLSANDYPYLLNNSNLFEQYNKTVNPFLNFPNRIERNLDYFYTINSSNYDYINHSLHIENYTNNDIDTNYEFNFNEYINSETDYFNSFFNRGVKFDRGNLYKNVKKYSEFNTGDNDIPNITLFRGIEYSIYSVTSIDLSPNGTINSIDVLSDNSFDDYKMSVLLTNGDSSLDWNIVTSWEIDKEYKIGDIVIFDDIIYECLSDTFEISLKKQYDVSGNIVDVSTGPYTSSDWGLYDSVITWSPLAVYNDFNVGTPSVVYNSSNFYECIDSDSLVDFWNPYKSITTGYDIDEIVIYKDDFYISVTMSNWSKPTSDNIYWSRITEPSNQKWDKISIWNMNTQYTSNSLVVYGNSVYICIENTELGEEPTLSILWVVVYDLEPNNIKRYGVGDMLNMNSNYYICVTSDNESILNNGIKVYINKRWRNVLINIYINDNTLPNLKNSDRDLLYNELYQNLIALNFINSINNISEKNGFINYIEYVVIDELNISSYQYGSDSFKRLPYMIICGLPDKLDINKMNKLTPIDDAINISPRNVLINRKINSINELDWYNGLTPFAFRDNNESSFVNSVLYRFSGYYMPIFYDIDIFSRVGGNYIFDTNLTNFGLMLERKIRKVNRFGSVLKSKNVDIPSIFPMVDEYGYTTIDFFIFKSTWDLEYHIETVENNIDSVIDSNKNTNTPITIGITPNLSNNKKIII